MAHTEQAENFRLAVLDALQRRPRRQRSIAWLARRIGKTRPTVSRAINRGEFPEVQRRIVSALSITLPAAPQTSTVQ